MATQRTRPPARPRPRGGTRWRDDGTSLAELLVAIAVFTVLALGVGSTAVVVLRTSSALEARVENATAGQVGVDAVSKVLRTAVLPAQLTDLTCSGCADTAVVSATRTQVRFYANLGGAGVQAPLLVTLVLEEDTGASQTSGQLVQRTQLPIVDPATQSYSFCNPTTPTCQVQRRVLARGLAWPAADTFFYYDDLGAHLSAASLAAADLPMVSSVEIALTVQTVRGHDRYRSSLVYKRVRLPNGEIQRMEDET